MATTKRRRGVGVKKWLIAALKEAAIMGGHKSHTQVANKIWTGKLGPLDSGCRKFKSEVESGSQGISMREAQWLALKVYAERRGEGESTSQIANKILVGKIEPLPKDCIDRGKSWAKEREGERAADEEKNPTPKPEKKTKKKTAKKAKAQSDKSIKEKSESASDSGTEPFSKKRKRKLSQGHVREPSGTPEQKTITPDAEYFGGIFSL